MNAAAPTVINALTVDVEDYFQVSAFERHVARGQWESFESRVCRNTERLLGIFDAAGVRATFFVLGWVAERFPGLVRQIAAARHEVASHGHAHRLIYRMTRRQFREDLRRARAALESACGRRVVGFRAPSYSITRQSLWALDVLIEEGYVYDASIFPIHHDRYGIPDAPRHPYRMVRRGGTVWEVPASTISWLGVNLPIAGGGYFRVLPYWWTRWGIRRLNGREQKPAVFYLHPWEMDPGQPRLQGSAFSRFRHYRNLNKTEPRLRRLLSDFRFAPVLALLQGQASSEVLRPRLSVRPAAESAARTQLPWVGQ